MGSGSLSPARAEWPKAVAARRSTLTTARFALYGKPLPRIEQAVRVGEAMRAAVMGKAKRLLGEDAIPRELSGHDLAEDNRHGHAFWLPEDFDHAGRSDGLIDHLLVHAPDGLSSDAVRVLTSLQSLRRDEGEPLRLMLEGMGSTEMLGKISHYLGESNVWRSITPYLHPWHRKEGFGYAEQIQRECLLRGWGEPKVSIENDIAVGGGRRARPIRFHRFRHKRGITQPDRLGAALRLEFESPISGPLALGYGCHFGLGLFAPIK